MTIAYIDRAKTVSWMTPQYVLDWWHEIFQIEEFDLDPACHPQSLVKARKKFHGDGVEDDGFLQDWTSFGEFMFTNPPYGDRPPKLKEGASEEERRQHDEYMKVFHPCTKWIQKYDVAAQLGMRIGAVLPAATSNAWFHDYIATRSTAFCLLKKRIKFLLPQPDGTPKTGDNPGQAHMLVLWSHGREDHIERFVRLLEPHGLCIVPDHSGEEHY